jgi:phage N-6-adenine-methyltransferase
MNPVHYSSATPEWSTPQDLFDELNREFGFVLDVCATAENAKCASYYSPERNGLEAPWAADVDEFGRPGACWMNPPYGKTICEWMAKARAEANKGAVVVCLVPSRTDTKWFQESFLSASEVRLLGGRVRFGNAKSCAPFPSCVFVFRPDPPTNGPRVGCWNYRR